MTHRQAVPTPASSRSRALVCRYEGTSWGDTCLLMVHGPQGSQLEADQHHDMASSGCTTRHGFAHPASELPAHRGPGTSRVRIIGVRGDREGSELNAFSKTLKPKLKELADFDLAERCFPVRGQETPTLTALLNLIDSTSAHIDKRKKVRLANRLMP